MQTINALQDKTHQNQTIINTKFTKVKNNSKNFVRVLRMYNN